MADVTTADVLDLIDAAVADWETGPEAVRYNATGEPQRWGPGAGKITLTIHQAAFTRAALAFETAVFPALCEAHASMLRFAKAFGPWPCRFSRDCFCHPLPFPAARDYRRRTRHRNRRRR